MFLIKINEDENGDFLLCLEQLPEGESLAPGQNNVSRRFAQLYSSDDHHHYDLVGAQCSSLTRIKVKEK